jgi:hypothetical protein
MKILTNIKYVDILSSRKYCVNGVNVNELVVRRLHLQVYRIRQATNQLRSGQTARLNAGISI